MNGSSIKYLLKEGIRNTWINRLMSFASVGVLTACLMLVGFAILLVDNLESMIGFVGQQSTIEVFLIDDATEKQSLDLQNEIEGLDIVESVTYISKEQALQDYSERLGNSELLDSLKGDNFLPASLRVSVSDLDQMDKVIEIAQDSDIYESHNVPTNVAQTITSIKNTITWFGIIVVAALVVVSLVIISNTIRATVFARRREINIMKQVGATNNFIRIPFLVEGIFLGIISALISFAIVWVGYEIILNILTTNTSSFLQSMFSSMIPFSDICWKIIAGFLVAGSATGAIGSIISLRNHLKV